VPAAVRLRVSAGRANITLRDSDPGSSFEIDAPNAAVSLVRPGSYRIAVDGAGNTTVAMRDGQAQIVTSAGQSIILRGGQGAQFGPNGAVEVAALAPLDDFDRWCAQREQRWASDQGAAGYLSSDVVGWQDLADNGDWSDEPDYGYVWYPTQVAADWAPYRYGRWQWITPWGWTWVDSAAWGYAPFHYGRWAYLRQRWAWVPAPPGQRAVYAPALVAWMGSPGATEIGWLPLAPGEVYLPGHPVSTRYLRDVNLSNTRIINNGAITSVYQNPGLQRRYANRDAPRAMTVVSQSSFTSGQPIATRIIAPPPTVVSRRRDAAAAGHCPFTPGRVRSRRAGAGEAAAARYHQSAGARPAPGPADASAQRACSTRSASCARSAGRTHSARCSCHARDGGDARYHCCAHCQHERYARHACCNRKPCGLAGDADRPARDPRAITAISATGAIAGARATASRARIAGRADSGGRIIRPAAAAAAAAAGSRSGPGRTGGQGEVSAPGGAAGRTQGRAALKGAHT
jgi:hypothetical protein